MYTQHFLAIKDNNRFYSDERVFFFLFGSDEMYLIDGAFTVLQRYRRYVESIVYLLEARYFLYK